MPVKSKRRNPVAQNLGQHRGGVHEKSKSSKRAATKRETRNKVSEWHSRSHLFYCASSGSLGYRS